ncbi:unnamed protein product [Parnassius apollo]|uniref:(apollo) hypothetical protein n=1 Tax=Parnassius apollo TaxID=110799 RepID=A0A8S3XKG3_PARAO|nr:unnamed protein product [Parnassius apollo]
MSSDSSTGKSPPKKKYVKYEQKFVNLWLKDDSKFKGWLKKSTKDSKIAEQLSMSRTKARAINARDFKIFQAFTNIKPHKLLHPSQSRWLSLIEVEQLPAIKLYFQAAVHVDRLLSAQSILSKALEPTTELYIEFLKFALPIFIDLNKEMQSETPKLYLLYDKILTAYTTILECFVQTEYLNLTEQEKNEAQNALDAMGTKILNLDFSSEQKHLPLQHIYVGGMVPNLIRRKREIGKLEEEQLKISTKSVGSFIWRLQNRY